MNNFYNRGQSLIGIIVVLIVASLIGGGLYYYLQKQIEKPAEKSISQNCYGGVLSSQCSTDKPKYCEKGNLIDRCSLCGCPSWGECQANGSCATPPTISRYYDMCWDYDCASELPPYPRLASSRKPDFIKANVSSLVRSAGKINIIVVLLYGEDPLSNENIKILKDSYQYVRNWFKKEASKYAIDLDLNIEFSNSQFRVPTEYIIRTYEESYSKNLTGYVKNNLPQFSSYDVIVPFYYGSYDFSWANHASSQNSFELFGKTWMSHFDFADSESFAHELTHLFGATDKYTCMEASSFSKSCVYAKQKGIGCWIESNNPNERGKDIMCHRKADYFDNISGEWVFGQPLLNELVIIEVTAKEIGWYDEDGDGKPAVNDLCPFNPTNNCF